jgi:ABC-type amino acid transport substrate-binding protein
MKKTLAICLAAILSASMLASCGEQKTTNDADGDGVPYNSMKDLEGKQNVVMNAAGTSEGHNAFIEEISTSDTSYEFTEPIFADTLSDMISTLKSGRADYAILFTPTAKYYAALDDTLGYTQTPLPPYDDQEFYSENYTVAMTTRAEDTELLGKINSAISELKADGTLETLLKNYVDGLSVAATDPIPVIDGAETIKVGITGDNPPFDYIDPAGKPAGFNVELMKAIAAKAGFNVEFVTINTNAKFAALESGRTDVHFFGTSLLSEIKEGYVQTEAYCGDITMSNLYVK